MEPSTAPDDPLPGAQATGDDSNAPGAKVPRKAKKAKKAKAAKKTKAADPQTPTTAAPTSDAFATTTTRLDLPTADNAHATTTARFNVAPSDGAEAATPSLRVDVAPDVAQAAVSPQPPSHGVVVPDATQASAPLSADVSNAAADTGISLRADVAPGAGEASTLLRADVAPDAATVTSARPEVPTTAAEASAAASIDAATNTADPGTPLHADMAPQGAPSSPSSEPVTPSTADASNTEDSAAIGAKRGRAKKGRSKRGRAKTNPQNSLTSEIHGDGPNGTGSLLPVVFSSDRIVDMGELEPVSESVRHILARPGGTPDGDLPQRIAVAAALPGEGASTISRVFSSVLSNDFGIETCRVDLSWGSTGQAGVYEVLTGEADVDDVLHWDGATATLHSGGVSGNEQHRLARSEELDKLITLLAGRFRHVVLDLPAILSGSDGLAMMRLADGYLLVVKHGATTLRQVQVATEQLSDVELLGSVLNHVRTRTPRPLSRWLAG